MTPVTQDDWLDLEEARGKPIGRVGRWLLRGDPRPLVILALGIPVWYFWEYRSPTVAMVGIAYIHDFCFGEFLFGLLAGARAVQWLARHMAAEVFNVPAKAVRCPHWFWPWVLVIGGGTYFMVGYEVPMRVSFYLSRPFLDRLADEALADPPHAHLLAGHWAGLYRVEGVEVIGSTVVLYLDRDGGRYGFARVPGAPADVIANWTGPGSGPPHHPDFPPHTGSDDRCGMRIADDWFVVYSLYKHMKNGWS